MAVIDPSKNWQVLEDRLAVETDPIKRRNLLNMLQHSKSELAFDFEATLSGMSEEAQHRSYNTGDPAQNPKGKAAILAYYEKLRDWDLLNIQSDCDNLVVDRDCVVKDGVLKMAYPGRVLLHMGIEVGDPDAYYLFQARVATFWPFDENGLSLGEHSYMCGDGFAGIAERKLKPGDIIKAPPYDPKEFEGRS
ncbi:MAG: hypothetical protein PHE36_02290 [Novosphingobium sp.]|nr:hypothetical protein [Novosphingobium sp.]